MVEDPRSLFTIDMIRRMRRFSSEFFLKETTACSLSVWRNCFSKREVVIVEISEKMKPPSCMASCNSEGIAWENSVTKQNNHDMALGEINGRNAVKLLYNLSGVRKMFLPRTVEIICSFKSTRKISASIFYEL